MPIKENILVYVILCISFIRISIFNKWIEGKKLLIPQMVLNLV